jgi:hypothetical protein
VSLAYLLLIVHASTVSGEIHDHPWVGAGAACWIEALGEFPDGALPEGGDSVTVVRGKKSCGTTIFG